MIDSNNEPHVAGQAMQKFFGSNKRCVDKIRRMYPKDHPQRVWLDWGYSVGHQLPMEFVKLTNLPWPKNMFGADLASHIRYHVLWELAKQRQDAA